MLCLFVNTAELASKHLHRVKFENSKTVSRNQVAARAMLVEEARVQTF